MSDDPLTRRLSQFTPDAGGLDRDELLFAAGRASARPNRRWIALAGTLAACQLMMLGLYFWPNPVALVPGPMPEPAPMVKVVPPVPLPVERESESAQAWRLRQRLIETEGNLPVSGFTEPMVPSEPGLRAFGPLPAELLN
jgi:hypothetical protein